MEHLDYFGSVIKLMQDEGLKIKLRITSIYPAFSKKKGPSHQQIGLTFKAVTNEVCIRCIDLRGAKIWTGRKIDRIYFKRSEMWCWRRIETILD